MIKYLRLQYNNRILKVFVLSFSGYFYTPNCNISYFTVANNIIVSSSPVMLSPDANSSLLPALLSDLEICLKHFNICAFAFCEIFGLFRTPQIFSAIIISFPRYPVLLLAYLKSRFSTHIALSVVLLSFTYILLIL